MNVIFPQFSSHMVFSSIAFILYFLPVFLLCYFLSPPKLKNYCLLLFSVFFYSWGAPRFIFVILGTTFIDFHLVKRMDQSKESLQRKFLLGASVGINVGLLFYFKYSNFFIDNVNALFTLIGWQGLTWTKLMLPIGISFYTFETITYVVDVYRKVHKPLDNFWNYLLYILLFPKLIAGPIVRYHDLADQLQDRSHSETADNRLIGFYRFALGLGKKVLIANHLGLHADTLLGLPLEKLDSYLAWSAILAYTFQIYFDFSGYSDMAIGIAQMLGFRIPENFNNPYISRSITEFWRRWHISLGNWMREYLYIPLGGNRVGSKARLYLNLWLVFLASGLWHGASWSFVVWGAYHGLFLVLERMFLGKLYQGLGKWIPMFLSFFMVCIGWVFFRIESLAGAWAFLNKLFAFEFSKWHVFDRDTNLYFVLAFLFSFLAAIPVFQKIQDEIYFKPYSSFKHLFMFGIAGLLLGLCIAQITGFGFNPFIYFRF
jgi:alginate O-acetyltransferase complex protein AlgI